MTLVNTNFAGNSVAGGTGGAGPALPQRGSDGQGIEANVFNHDGTVTTLSGSCKGMQATMIGTDKGDKITGTSSADVILGLGGNDKLSGLAGNDVICGGPGKDTLKGGKGKDKLYGEAGKDILKGGPGKDILKGGAAKDKQVQ